MHKQRNTVVRTKKHDSAAETTPRRKYWLGWQSQYETAQNACFPVKYYSPNVACERGFKGAIL
jgi:hypothetical protein